MNIKKTLAGVASYALVGAVALGIGGTLATYTDSDSDVNTATVGGGVDIEQHEYQRENVADAINYEEFEAAKTSGETFTPDLVPFEQKQALYPAYADYEEGERSPWTALGLVDGKNILNELFYWGDYVHTGTAGNGLWDPEKLTGAMDKFVFVENTGESDCYFRTIIAFECPEGVTVGDAGAGATIGMNVNGSTIWDDDFVDYITIDDVRYKMYEFIYTDILHPKEQAHPSLLQVAFSDKMTNEEAELLGDTYEILVFSQACQVENLPTNDGVATASAEDVKSNAEMALDTAFYDVAKEHHPWLKTTHVSNESELYAALDANDVVILENDISVTSGMGTSYGKAGIVQDGEDIFGQNNTLSVSGSDATWDCAIGTEGGKIANLNVKGAFRGIFAYNMKQDVIIENCTLEAVYPIHSDSGTKSFIVRNSKLLGWTSFCSSMEGATFTDCYFGQGCGYAFMRPYAPTTLTNCEFEENFKFDAGRTSVTFVDCYYNGELITEENYATFVYSGTPTIKNTK